jgi:DNA-binding NarL/FixJ family response regulator
MVDAMGAVAFASRVRAEFLATGRRAGHRVERASFELTAQEAQVARLAAVGATNAEIADRMFVTTSTVECHLSKIFRKLDINSRRQLALALSS